MNQLIVVLLVLGLGVVVLNATDFDISPPGETPETTETPETPKTKETMNAYELVGAFEETRSMCSVKDDRGIVQYNDPNCIDEAYGYLFYGVEKGIITDTKPCGAVGDAIQKGVCTSIVGNALHDFVVEDYLKARAEDYLVLYNLCSRFKSPDTCQKADAVLTKTITDGYVTNSTQICDLMPESDPGTEGATATCTEFIDKHFENNPSGD